MANNKALKMNEIVVVKYLFKEDWEPLDEVIDRHPKEFGKIHELTNDKDVVQLINESPATLIIAAVTGKDDLTKVLNFLRVQKRLIKESNTKVSVVNYLNNKQVETALMKLGCQEVLDPSMKSKALKFKMDFWKKALSLGSNKVVEQKLTLKDKSNEMKAEAPKLEGPAIKWLDPLKLVDDMWITKSPNDVKKVLSKWLVKLMGPSPFVAQWVEVPGQKGVWQFTFKENARESFHMADGHWFYTGDQKPEFIWKENLWMISGQKFHLYYQDEGENVTRFRASPTNVEISKNSNYGLSREKAIIESFDQEVLVKKGLLDNSKTDIKEDEKKDAKLLTQDVSDEKPIDGKLKGKVALELEDAKKDTKTSAKADQLGGNYEGDSETEDLGGGNYDGKVDQAAQKKKNEDLRNAKSDRLKNEDGDAGTDDVGLSKYKGKMEHGHTDRKSNYGGESETDDLGESHYSNRPGQKVTKEKKAREREEYESDEEVEEREERERKGYKEAKKGAYSGESETDDLGEDHYSNQKKEARPEKEKKAREKTQVQDVWEDEEEEEEVARVEKKKKARAEREKGSWSEEESEDLSGKTSTDDLGEDYYSNEKAESRKAKPAKHKPAASVGHEYEDEEEESEEPISGRRTEAEVKEKKRSKGTEDLGSSHYSGKVSKPQIEEAEEEEEVTEGQKKKVKKQKTKDSHFEEEEYEDYDGESSTDKLKNDKLKGKIGPKKSVVDPFEDDEEETEVEQETAAVKKIASAREKKMRMLDDLLPEGNAEDPAEEILPEAFDDAPSVKVPVQRMKPKLVKPEAEEGTDEEDETVSARGEKEKGVRPTRQPSEKEKLEVIQDDGRPVVNEQVTVTAILKRKANPNVEHIVNMDDYFEKTVILRLNENFVSIGEAIELTMTFEYMKKAKKVSVGGKCIENQADPAGETFCTIELDAIDVKLFEQFMTLYQLRQQHIAHFIKSAKGL